jgi:alkanesulfonate monooxygenase SsuD/methylene tetrahydromethanopterin reductase-like flavin-dependent oxidoreductase (luciferase family)
MEFGIMPPGGGHSIREGIEIARLAEERGFASVYCVEAFCSALVPLAAIAASTRRVRVGPYILNAWGRSPWLTSLCRGL